MIKLLKCLDGRILASDPYPSEEAKALGEVPLHLQLAQYTRLGLPDGLGADPGGRRGTAGRHLVGAKREGCNGSFPGPSPNPPAPSPRPHRRPTHP